MNFQPRMLALAMLTALAATSAHAAEMANNDIGLLLGAGFGDNDVVGDDKDGDAVPLVGLRYTKRLGDSGFNFFSDATYGDYESSLPAIGDTKLYTLRGGFELNVINGESQNTFVALGFGATHFSPDVAETFTRGLVSLGVGQAWAVGRNDALRWELRVDQTLGSETPLKNSVATQFQALVGYSWGIGEPPDSDSDGVINRFDQCIKTPSGTKVDGKGCPLDGDMDGVFDGPDQCPDTPAGVKVDDKGCPLDKDGDGIPDDKDKCVDEAAPGTEDGCLPPPPPVVEVAPEPAAEPAPMKKLVLKDVFFDFDSSNLRESSKTELDAAAASLGDWGRVRIEVAGHTDSMGPKAHNQALSLARAEAVRGYLISKGIEADRLEAVGYGDTKPIESNDTVAGRVVNRRVELTEIE